MKLVIAAVVAVGIGSVAASIWIGRSVREDTVVANPYEEGLRYDEHRRAADLPARDSHGRGRPLATAALEIAPQPPRAMSDLTFTVRLARGGAPLEASDVSIALAMPGMYMGENRVRLAPAGGGVYRGTGTVVRCPSGGRTWTAEVTGRPADGGPAIASRFTFEVAP